MLRLFFVATALAVAYKLGENKARLDTLDFFITKSMDLNGMYYVEYVSIDSGGNVEFTNDMNQATVLNYFDATVLKGIIKKFAPINNLKIETVSTIITAQQQ